MRDGFALGGDWRGDAVIIHVAMDDLVSDDLLSLHKLLDEAEVERAERFHFDVDRHAFIAAHGLLRLCLGTWVGRSPQQLAFNSGPYGKPALVRGGAAFNLSHSRRMVAVAIAPHGEVGVDVELNGQARAPELDIADRFFSPAEVALIAASGDEQAQRETFMRIWNLKEAVIKATGRGLAQELTGFSVAPAAGDAAPTLTCHEDWLRAAGEWRLAQWAVGDHLIAAASLNGPARPLRLLKLTGTDLAGLAAGTAVMA